MKKLMFLFALIGSLTVNAQADVRVENETSVEIEVRIHKYDANNCNTYIGFDSEFIAPGDFFEFNANAGEEYTFLDFASTPCGMNNFGGTVGTPSYLGCAGNCSYAGPSSITGTTTPCGLNTSFSARWTNCGPIGGLVIISDY